MKWIEDTNRFVNLGSPIGLVSETHIVKKLDSAPNLSFPYFQLNNLVRSLQQQYDVLCHLTHFELMLRNTTLASKGRLSRFYILLLLLSEISNTSQTSQLHWDWHLKYEISSESWYKISYLGAFLLLVILLSSVYELPHWWHLIPNWLNKWFLSSPDYCWRWRYFSSYLVGMSSDPKLLENG